MNILRQKKFSLIIFILFVFLSLIGCGEVENDTKPNTDINEEPIMYKVIFNYDNGTENKVIEIESGNKVLEPIENPTKEGYTFDGWYYGNNKFIFDEMEIKEDVTLSAKWVKKIDYLNLFIEKMNDNLKQIDMKKINLLNSFEGIKTIEWTCNNKDIISDDGIITRPYTKTNVTLVANVELDTGEKESVEFSVEIPGYKLEQATTIASTYLYRNYSKMDDTLFDTLDIIFCAFAIVGEDGEFTNPKFFNNVKNYIIPKAKEKGVYVVLSLAPESKWTVFTNPDNNLIDKVIDNCITKINEIGFDGVDIDWERPKSGQETWFTTFAKKLNLKVKENNPNHLITAAIGAGKWQPPSYDLPNSEKYLDYVNVMTYGMETSSMHYQNALYKSKNTTASCSIDESITIFENLKVNKNKLLIGLAFYGIKQKYENGKWIKDGSVLYNKLLESYLNEGNTEFEVFYDDVAQVPYLMNKEKTIFVSYDNEQSIKVKCKYVIDNKIAGVMAWEAGCDISGTLLKAIEKGLNN